MNISPISSSQRLSSNAIDAIQMNDGMLVFDDLAHFHQVLADLETMANNGESTSVDSVLLQFADNLGFESLHRQILTEENLLSEGDGITEENDPDNHFIMDSYFRAVLNSNMEIQIGSKFYKLLDKYRSVEIAEKDIDALNDFRQNGDNAISFYSPNVTILNGVNGTKMLSGAAELQACVANFTWIQPNINSTLVNFTNNSSQHSSVQWTISNGTNYNQVFSSSNLSHQLPSYGTYTVTLQLYGTGCGTALSTKTQQITLNSCSADFDFAIVGDNIVNFTNRSSGTQATNISWDFGNGSFGGGGFPTHQYFNAGTYNVKMTISNNNGCSSSITKQVTLNFNGCCDAWDREPMKDEEYIPGARKVKCVGWSKNFWPLNYHKLGTKLKNYKKKSNGNWKKETADFMTLGIKGTIWPQYPNSNCTNDFNIGHTVGSKSQTKEYEKVYSYGSPFRLQYHSVETAYVITDGGATKNFTIFVGCN